MSSQIVEFSLIVAQVMLALAMVLAAYRMILGPRAQDRVLALDAFYVTGMLMLVTVGIRIGTSIFFEVALVIGMLGFVSTVALAKFLMRGEVIE
ncbi:K+/H+ antiporter subunit F [Pelagibacterium sp. 26DY04]|uniref:K+/H+ antiporter subunit F n=1 Tax=unclassified Pelagibacterium TaxID=2623280 RepID=UPI00281618BE|nr:MULTISPECIES: K+/H+ antiporter subunit F [unclassified Pelagibacterium]WMT86821.1 K+/H+ antiporter subunit F [Pelagibacterium sp. 26DY04]WMT89029.1 K+/H+ antiporter subunit F [Pelagibacterium sp. H642]